MVLCVVMFSLQSNCFVTVLHVVSHCCPGYCNACQLLCLLSLLLLVPSFVNLGMALGSIASGFFCFTNVICWRRVCRSHFRMLVLVVSIFVFGVVGVVVVSMPRVRVCARVEDLSFGCLRVICWNQLVQFGGSCFPWR